MTAWARRSPDEVKANQRVARRLPSRFTFNVVGVSHRSGYPNNVLFLDSLVADLRRVQADPDARRHFLSEHVAVMERALIEGAVPVELVREPDNPADPDAVAVCVCLVPEIGCVGYVPAATHGRLAPLLAADMDAGGRWEGVIPLDGVRVDRDHPSNPGIRVTVYRID